MLCFQGHSFTWWMLQQPFNRLKVKRSSSPLDPCWLPATKAAHVCFLPPDEPELQSITGCGADCTGWSTSFSMSSLDGSSRCVQKMFTFRLCPFLPAVCKGWWPCSAWQTSAVLGQKAMATSPCKFNSSTASVAWYSSQDPVANPFSWACQLCVFSRTAQDLPTPPLRLKVLQRKEEPPGERCGSAGCPRPACSSGTRWQCGSAAASERGPGAACGGWIPAGTAQHHRVLARPLHPSPHHPARVS